MISGFIVVGNGIIVGCVTGMADGSGIGSATAGGLAAGDRGTGGGCAGTEGPKRRSGMTTGGDAVPDSKGFTAPVIRVLRIKLFYYFRSAFNISVLRLNILCFYVFICFYCLLFEACSFFLLCLVICLLFLLLFSAA